MMKKLLSMICILLFTLSLTACGQAAPAEDSTSDTLQIACTTYPVYLLAQSVTEGAKNVELSLMIDQQISCLHNYSLTTQDMKAVEAADVVVINGGGLEEFLEDVLEGRTVVDCSEGIDLLWNEEEQEDDPHFWLDPARYGEMAQTLAQGLAELDGENAEQYAKNAENIQTELADFQTSALETLSSLSCRQLITFHDGFEYFAEAFELEIVAAVEEEEGSEASAQRIGELLELVDKYQLTAVFTECNGSDSAARALSQERDLGIYALNMGMSRDTVPNDLTGLDAYEWILSCNIDTLVEAYE